MSAWAVSQFLAYRPCLILSEEETQPIGLWGQRHKQYLKEHKQFLYTTMLIEGTLNRYLANINQQAAGASARPTAMERAPVETLPCLNIKMRIMYVRAEKMFTNSDLFPCLVRTILSVR